MLGITLLCVGKLKETYFADALDEYRKRLGAYCRFTVTELAEQRLSGEKGPSEKEIAAALEREAAELERRIPAGAAVCAFCVEGNLLSSAELAERLGAWAAGGQSRVCFLIGGSYGLSERLKRRAELRLSMSRMTFPHHLFRVMAAEQIYRAFTILEGGKYHK